MYTRLFVAFAGLTLTSTAVAGSRAGVGLSASFDLPDTAAAEHTHFGAVGGIMVPVHLHLGTRAALRLAARADAGPGRDRLLWTEGGQRVHQDDHFAFLASVALAVGVEVGFTEQGVVPYVAASGGPAWVATYHSLGADAAVLLDPAQNDLADPRNIDPFASNLVLAYELGAGLRLAGPVVPWFELCYANAYVPETRLLKTPEARDATRAAFGWNRVRPAVGVSFRL